jgi:hypothetical protein
MPALAIIPTPALEGDRVLWRHWQRPTSAAIEGWLREFSADGRRVRICATQKPKERGHWHECRQIRIDAVLDASSAPAESGDEEGNP